MNRHLHNRRVEMGVQTVDESTDKRTSSRMNVAHSAEFRVTGTESVETGQLKDISEGGFLFSAVRELDPGTGLAVKGGTGTGSEKVATL